MLKNKGMVPRNLMAKKNVHFVYIDERNEIDEKVKFLMSTIFFFFTISFYSFIRLFFSLPNIKNYSMSLYELAEKSLSQCLPNRETRIILDTPITYDHFLCYLLFLCY